MTQYGALVIVGSGPGIGAHVATTFAKKGFRHIVLMSRNLRRLSDDAMIIRANAPGTVISLVSVDLAKVLQVEDALTEVDRALIGVPIECVFFNAVKPQMSRIIERSVQELRQDFDISVTSLYAVMRWSMPHFLAPDLVSPNTYKPTLLVTSGDHVDSPSPEWFSLTACRAAQQDMIASCSKDYGPKGIHCGLFLVQTRASEADILCNAPLVAEDVWKMYNQPPALADSTVQMRVPKPEEGNHMDRTGVM